MLAIAVLNVAYTSAMLVPVACLSCGCQIGHVAAIFRRMREERIKAQLAALDTIPERAAENLRASMDISDLMDKLGIKYDCCRMHLSSNMDWREFY